MKFLRNEDAFPDGRDHMPMKEMKTTYMKAHYHHFSEKHQSRHFTPFSFLVNIKKSDDTGSPILLFPFWRHLESSLQL